MGRIAGFVGFLGMAIAFVIGVGIALVVLDAKETNDVITVWLDVSRWLTEPFHGMFDLERGKEDLQLGINWGLAALVYLVVALVVARLLRGVGRPSFLRRRSTATTN
jgi:hypothetical protein